ncbi:PQ loop repeat-domain-containing protein [Terfezia claveryi]|nr:PQ loop repeat-domain-containing protein [Terfezia claveryi]
MFPPAQNLNLDAWALSGITGSISISCWVIVFSPQIIVNFRRGSADGLSLTFLVIWLLGDVFNVLGAVLQGVLPTMVILAIYYTLADIVLLGQCLYYKCKAARYHLPAPVTSSDAHVHQHHSEIVHFTILFNTTAIVMVCLAGIVGWLLTPAPPHSSMPDDPHIKFDVFGQVFGYLCAVLYLASRIPQIYLNYQRKAVDGLSLLFFLFACLGNLTYVISIIAYVPYDADNGNWTPEISRQYWRYIAINASWLLGSVGTLLLDMIIFVQFFWYRDIEDEYEYESLSDSESIVEDDYHY